MMILKNSLAIFAVLFLSGCAGVMLPGRMYAHPSGRTLQFQIQTSYGNGRMTAADPVTGEKFSGEYSGFYKGQEAVMGSVGGLGVSLVKPPTGANAFGILVGDKGTTIRLYFEIKPGPRPTGHGMGRDQAGKEYEVFF